MSLEPRLAAAAAAVAVAMTGLIGSVALFLSSYWVTTCFRRPDGFGGCGTALYPFSPEALPALLWPAALLAVLVLLAAVAWRTRSITLAGVATTAFATLAAGPILLVAPLLGVPVALLYRPDRCGSSRSSAASWTSPSLRSISSRDGATR